MAVYQQPSPRGKLRWMIDFTWVDAATGKRKRIRRAAKDPKGRPARSRTAAEQAELALRTALADGTFERTELLGEAVVPTLREFEQRYFRDHVAKLKASSRSAQATIWRVSLLPVLGDLHLDGIDAEAIARLTRVLLDRGASPKTVNNALSALRTALTHAEDWKLISAVPRVKWLKVPQQKFDFFTFEEVEALLPHAPPMVVVALRTGMRLGELLALRWSDVSLERRQITVSRSVWWERGGKPHEAGTKSGKVRTVPLTNDTADALGSIAANRLPGSTHVFTNPAGTQLSKGECKWPLWRAQCAAGLRTTGWHVLRHTFASHLVMHGVPLPSVQALMGHSTIHMTMRYAHVAPDHLRAAVIHLERAPPVQ